MLECVCPLPLRVKKNVSKILTPKMHLTNQRCHSHPKRVKKNRG